MLSLIYGIVFTNWLRTDGPTDRRTDGWTDQRTDRQSLLYRCEDASKNVRMYLRHSSNVIFDLWYMILNHFGVNHFISVVFTNWLWTDRPTDGWTNGWMDRWTDGPTDRRTDRQPLIEMRGCI